MPIVLSYLLMIVTIGSGMILLMGLFKPWIALWWMPRQNRLLVIKWYGGIFLVTLAGWLLTRFIAY